MTLSQWQCLFYLQLHESDALTKHRLLIECFGLSYQQVIYQPVKSNIHCVTVFITHFIICYNDDTEVLVDKMDSKLLKEAYLCSSQVVLNCSESFILDCLELTQNQFNSSLLSDVIELHTHQRTQLSSWQKKKRNEYST